MLVTMLAGIAEFERDQSSYRRGPRPRKGPWRAYGAAEGLLVWTVTVSALKSGGVSMGCFTWPDHPITGPPGAILLCLHNPLVAVLG